MRSASTVLLLLLFFLPLQAQKAVFRVDTIGDSVFRRMQGRSYPEGCTVKRSDLRYLTVSHYDLDGQIRQGELVCNKRIAADLIDIFRALFRARYPIARMQLIDDYEADDERSMEANNTSCFCYRVVNGSKKLSKHAEGLAIDINPLYNPYVKGEKVLPRSGRSYLDRTASFPCKIERNDLLCRLFRQHGFRWGGAWRSVKDYQHFEK